MAIVTHGFTYNGRSTTVFKVRTTGDATWTKPVPIYERVSVPGRNGDIVIPTGAYENVSVIYKCGIKKDMEEQYHAFVNFLLSNPGYHRLEDTYHPDYYRMAIVESIGDPALGWRYNSGEFEVVFSCKPQMFLKSGETTTTFTATGNINNPTLFDAKPLLRVYGTGEFVVGSDTVRITSANSYTDIDCETENAYKNDASVNCNGNIVLSGDSFPVIPPGSQRIILRSGISRIEVKPRWWQL